MTQPPTPPPADPPTDPPAPPADPPGDPAKKDEPLGAAGLKALQEEREARKALEKRLAALEPLAKLAGAIGGDKPDGKSDVELLTERLASHETELKTERLARWRAEVGAEKGLTPAQAARLVGTTREELLADADALATLFPAAAAGPRTPAPDPSQGARGTGEVDVETQIADARKKGDWKTVMRLENTKLAGLMQASRTTS